MSIRVATYLAAALAAVGLAVSQPAAAQQDAAAESRQ